MLEYGLTFLLLIILAFSFSRLLKFKVKGTIFLIVLVLAIFITAAILTADLGTVFMDAFAGLELWWDSVLRTFNIK